MSNISNDFGAFIDDLRKSRNISREDFIDEIISIRQYQRYIKGESSINNEKLLLLVEKFGMDFFSLHNLFLKRSKDEIFQLNFVYKKITENNFNEAFEQIEKINKDSIQDVFNKSFYELCYLIIMRRTNRLPIKTVMRSFEKLVDYPNCLKNEVINFVEFVSLIELSQYSSDEESVKDILNYLYDSIKNDNLVSNSMSSSFIPSIHSVVSSALGAINEFDKSLFVSQKGIDYCLTHDNLNSLAHLFYYKATTLRRMGKIDEAIKTSKTLFALLLVENKENKTKDFTRIFEKHFQMKVSDL